MSTFIPVQKKGNAKECSNYCTAVLISHASKVMLEILQASLQQCVNRELPIIQAGFRKVKGTRGQRIVYSNFIQPRNFVHVCCVTVGKMDLSSASTLDII